MDEPAGRPFRIPPELIDHLNRGDCVLFVGDALDEQGSQSARLAAALVDACGAHAACADSACRAGDKCPQPEQCVFPLTRAAQLYESSKGRHQLVDFVTRHVQGGTPTALHRALAELPVRVIITTAYDDRLEVALREAGRSFLQVVRDTDVPFDDPDRVQLIRLHGTVSQSDSLVLTEDDAADLFVRLNPVTRIILQAHLASKTLLFVGYRLQAPYFRLLYRQVTIPIDRCRRPAFALQWPRDPLSAASWQGQIAFIEAEPLPFLTQLIQATQPAIVEAVPIPLPPEPYKFLDYYTREDVAIFFGRDLEADLLLSTVLAHNLTVFYGRSGTGKTSLLLARVIPDLEKSGYQVAYARMLGDPIAEIKAAVRGVSVSKLTQDDLERDLLDVLVDVISPAGPSTPLRTGRLVVVLDQFEEFFIRQGEAVREAFAQEVADCLGKSTSIDLRFILSLRDDYLGSLDEMSPFLPQDVFAHRYKIEALTREKALLAILKPAEAFGLPVEETLREQLIDDLEDQAWQGQGLEPANLQIVLYRLYRDAVEQGMWDEQAKRGTGLTLTGYQALGGTKEILTGYLDEVLDELPDAERQHGARAILKSMVTAERTKVALSGQEIARGDLVSKVKLEEGQLDELLAYLREKRILRKFGDEDRYELAHEMMVEKVLAWVSDEELRALKVRDMLRRELTNYRDFGHLMSQERLGLVYESQETIRQFSPEELELLLISALVRRYPVDGLVPALQQLGKESQTTILKAVVDIVEGEHYYKIKAEAIRLLACFDIDESISYIVDWLFDDHFFIRWVADEASFHLDPARIISQLALKCLDPDPKVRFRAALYMRRRSTLASVTALKQLRTGEPGKPATWTDSTLEILTKSEKEVTSGTPTMSCLAFTDGSDFASGIIAQLTNNGHLVDVPDWRGLYRHMERFFPSADILLNYQSIFLFRGDNFERGGMPTLKRHIISFVQNGGTLVATPWVAWEDRGNLNSILPVRIAPRLLAASFHEDQRITWVIANVNHPLCQGIAPVLLRGSYESLIGSDDAEILIHNSQGNPALALKSVGLGQVIYVNVCGHDCPSNPWDESIELRRLFANIIEYLVQRYCSQTNDVQRSPVLTKRDWQ